MICIGKHQIDDKNPSITVGKVGSDISLDENGKKRIFTYEDYKHTPDIYRVYVGDEMVYPDEKWLETPYKLVVEYHEVYLKESTTEVELDDGRKVTPRISEIITDRKLTIETTLPLFVKEIDGIPKDWELYVAEDKDMGNGVFLTWDRPDVKNIKKYLPIILPFTVRFINGGKQIDLTTMHRHRDVFSGCMNECDKTYIYDEWHTTENQYGTIDKKTGNQDITTTTKDEKVLYYLVPNAFPDEYSYSKYVNDDYDVPGDYPNYEFSPKIVDGKMYVAGHFLAGDKIRKFSYVENITPESGVQEMYFFSDLNDPPPVSGYVENSSESDAVVIINGIEVNIPSNQIFVVELPKKDEYDNRYSRYLFSVKVVDGIVTCGSYNRSFLGTAIGTHTMFTMPYLEIKDEVLRRYYDASPDRWISLEAVQENGGEFPRSWYLMFERDRVGKKWGQVTNQITTGIGPTHWRPIESDTNYYYIDSQWIYPMASLGVMDEVMYCFARRIPSREVYTLRQEGMGLEEFKTSTVQFMFHEIFDGSIEADASDAYSEYYDVSYNILENNNPSYESVKEWADEITAPFTGVKPPTDQGE